jgi:hypothetical protein
MIEKYEISRRSYGGYLKSYFLELVPYLQKLGFNLKIEEQPWKKDENNSRVSTRQTNYSINNSQYRFIVTEKDEEESGGNCTGNANTLTGVLQDKANNLLMEVETMYCYYEVLVHSSDPDCSSASRGTVNLHVDDLLSRKLFEYFKGEKND